LTETPKQWLAWLRRLLPKHEVHGDNAIQVGKVGGHVTVVHLTQNITHALPEPTKRAASNVTPAHKDALARMKPLTVPARVRVLEFMRREFGTTMVIELNDHQVYRLRRYVEVVGRRRGTEAKGGR
jgi:hypothetical protein